ncbi:MAG: M28 family peptidase [Verrucomicrobiales bacterium]|nr:M28 family peptidase [Verrucomicrobiales bacterium]
MANEGKPIRIVLVALPLGLLILGIASMLFTQFKPDTPEMDEDYDKRMDAASLNRKPVNRADLERFVRILSEEIGERNLDNPTDLERAAIWIQSTLKSGNMGYEVDRQMFPVDGVEVRNLMVELTGTRLRKEIVLVGAHYDTVAGSPGANAGGSGVAALLSLAQAFAGDRQERTIRFVFFTNEEPPYFGTENMGSRVYAKRSSTREEKIVAMLSLDSLGCFRDEAGSQMQPEGVTEALPDTGNFIVFSGNDTAKFRADSARNILKRESGIEALSVELPDLKSDEVSFAKYGYPSVLVSDTAKYRYPDFHQSTDTMEKIDFERLEKTCQALKQIVEIWANP